MGRPPAPPAGPAAASSVAYRREPGNEHAFDKLILAPSRQPGATLVMAELYARGYHAHEDQLGAILYYERPTCRCCTAWAITIGRPNRPICSYSPPPGEPFPHKPTP